MTVALYRRYRPDTFDDLVGQDHVTRTLKNAIDHGRISHAYLFSGPRGCGKTTSARIMARCLNCAQGPTSSPCGVCESCVELAAGGPGSLDVVEIDAASHNGVDDARELRERAAFAPARDNFKIFILDEAHMVTTQGFNALLKLVEEPPPHVKFIFATTEPDKVIGTIRSRTHHYPFRLVAPNVLIPYLQTLCEREGVAADPRVLDLVVRAGGGSVRDSLSVLDQLMAGAEGGSLSYEQSVALLGYTDSALLDGMIDALGANDGAAVFRVVDQATGSGHDPRRFTEDLLQRVRDLLICVLAPAQAAEILPQIPSGQLERMQVQAQAWGSKLLSRRADLIEGATRTMTGATSPRLQLELLMGRLLVAQVPEQATSTVSVPVPQPFRQPAIPAVAAPKIQPTPTPKPTSVEGQSAQDIQSRWEEIAKQADMSTRIAGALLRQASPVQVRGTVLHIGANAGMVDRLSGYQVQVQEAVRQVLGSSWTVQIGNASNDQAGPTATPAVSNGWGPVAVPGGKTEPAAPEPELQPQTLPEPEPQPEPDPIEEWDDGDGVSLDDATIASQVQSGLPVLLDVLGGEVIESNEGQGS